MKLYFLGANRQVTGSKYCLRVGTRNILIDAGLFQERPFEHRNWEPCPIPPAEISAMLLTHAHLDHCGLIPRLVNAGMQCPIYCTPPTAPLAEVVLRDSAGIQEEDAAYKRKRHEREHRRDKFPIMPLYTEADVAQVIPLFRPVDYRTPVEVVPGVRATFHDAGHVLGSAMIEIEARENGTTRRILFSGDIGQWHKPLICDPSLFESADYVVMESTYGDREHEDAGDVESQLARVVSETAADDGKVVIPTFALERAQELMYYFARLVHAQRIPALPVYLDSPMAIDITAIFARFHRYFDAETNALLEAGTSPMKFAGLHFARSADESKAINLIKGPSVIMSSSGMCTAGRIKHHLRNNIGNSRNTILFVGHQGTGTLGREILDGASHVRIHGQPFEVRARIAQIFGFSGHADRPALLKWLTHIKAMPKKIFLTHGEETVSLGLANEIRQGMRWPAHVPQYNEAFDLE